MDEAAFQAWYASHAQALGMNPNPDDPRHKYDYRAAFRAGAEPAPDGHWDSRFKADDHPNRFIDGIDTRTGERGYAAGGVVMPEGFVSDEVPEGFEPEARGVGQIVMENLKATPGRMLDKAKDVVSTFAPPDPQWPTGKIPIKTGLGVTGGGPGSTVLTRLGSIAAGHMLDQPSGDWWENVKTAGKGVVGDLDWRKPMSTILSPAVMETLGAATPVGGKIFRSTGYGARKVAEADAARVGGAMDEVAPTLKAGTTAPEMQLTAEGRGLGRINAAKESLVQDLERGIAPGQPGTFTPPGEMPVPSLTPLGKSTWSLRDANAELSSIGDQMRGIKPLDPRLKDADLNKLYGQVANDIREGIRQVSGDAAASAWNMGQAEYHAGRSGVLPLLERQGLFQQGQFNLPDLQRWLRVPANRASLQEALGANAQTGENMGAYNKLVDAITRGAGAGMVDSARGLGFTNPHGSWGTLGALYARGIAKALPNAPMRYVGRVPYAPARPAGDIQTLLDLAAQGGER